MLSYLHYRYLAFRNPSRTDYLDMGFGISARFERCRRYWLPHIELCKSLQAETISDASESSIVSILGAGRLIDIDLSSILLKSSKVRLVDADPALVGVWQRATAGHSKIIPMVVDLTQSIDNWTGRLVIFLGKNYKLSSIESFLLSLEPLPGFNLRLANRDHIIISQNILGQIGIYWRDRVLDLLVKAKILSEEDILPEGVEAALAHSIRRLEEQHIKMVSEAGASKILLISDQFYHYYRSDSVHWQTENALQIGDISKIEEKICNCDYKVATQRNWLWHIAPQGIEFPDHGAIHQVYGAIFERV